MSRTPRVVQIVKTIYKEVLVDKYKDQHFWILGAFIITFAVARLLVKVDPRIFLSVHGAHVHHFTYGFFLLGIAGYIAIVRPKRAPPWLAILFGVGLALSVDEAGMWLHLTDQYYNETSENALILVAALLINVVYFKEFWLRLVLDLFYWLKNSVR